MEFRQLRPENFEDVYRACTKSFYTGSTKLFLTEEQFLENTYRKLVNYLEQPDLFYVGCFASPNSTKPSACCVGYGEPFSKTFHVPVLWVDSTERNKHIGTRIAQACFNFAVSKGYQGFMVETASTNQPMKRILKNIGFHNTSLIWTLNVRHSPNRSQE